MIARTVPGNWTVSRRVQLRKPVARVLGPHDRPRDRRATVGGRVARAGRGGVIARGQRGGRADVPPAVDPHGGHPERRQHDDQERGEPAPGDPRPARGPRRTAPVSALGITTIPRCTSIAPHAVPGRQRSAVRSFHAQDRVEQPEQARAEQPERGELPIEQHPEEEGETDERGHEREVQIASPQPVPRDEPDGGGGARDAEEPIEIQHTGLPWNTARAARDRRGTGSHDRSQKYAHSSIIVTTSVPFDQWGRIFGDDDVIAAAILDRLLHHSEIFAISGPSYRLRGKLAQ